MYLCLVDLLSGVDPLITKKGPYSSPPLHLPFFSSSSILSSSYIKLRHHRYWIHPQRSKRYYFPPGNKNLQIWTVTLSTAVTRVFLAFVHYYSLDNRDKTQTLLQLSEMFKLDFIPSLFCQYCVQIYFSTSLKMSEHTIMSQNDE